MAPMVLMLVGLEKEIEDFEAAVQGCKAKVGPLKVFTAYKAVQAVSKLLTVFQQCGKCDAVMMSHHFTAKGKEEYSDAIKKTMKEKYPTVPIICWGHPKKGGTEGKDFHYGVDWAPANGSTPLIDVLLKLRNGDIVAEYKAKGKDKDKPDRKSLDKAPATPERRKSLEGSASPSKKSLDGPPAAVASARRTSMESAGAGPGSPMRRTSMEGRGSMSAIPSFMGSNPGSPRGSLDLARSPMMGMGMTPMSNLGMGSMGVMGSMGSMTQLPSMTPMTGMGAMGGMTPMTGMGGMTPMTGMGGLGGMTPMTGMGGMLSTGTSMVNPRGSMTGVAPGVMPSVGQSNLGMSNLGGGSMVGSLGYGSMGIDANMGMQPSMQQQAAFQSMAPAPSPATVPEAPSPNAELIKALADEVFRLKTLVEEKRAKEAPAAAAADVGMGGLSLGVNMGVVSGLAP